MLPNRFLEQKCNVTENISSPIYQIQSDRSKINNGTLVYLSYGCSLHPSQEVYRPQTSLFPWKLVDHKRASVNYYSVPSQY